jgi:hypothetical protein
LGEKSVLIRTTPLVKNCISDEVAAARGQERYMLNMDRTLNWISSLEKIKSVKENVRIVNTGLIHYSKIDKIMPLLDRI